MEAKHMLYNCGAGFVDGFLSWDTESLGQPHKKYDSGKGFGYATDLKHPIRAEDIAILYEAIGLVRGAFDRPYAEGYPILNRVELVGEPESEALAGGEGIESAGSRLDNRQRVSLSLDFKYPIGNEDYPKVRSECSGFSPPQFGAWVYNQDAGKYMRPPTVPAVAPRKSHLFKLLMLIDSLGSPGRTFRTDGTLDDNDWNGRYFIHGSEPSSDSMTEGHRKTGTMFDRDYMSTRLSGPIVPELTSSAIWNGELVDEKQVWPFRWSNVKAMHDAICGRTFYAVVPCAVSYSGGSATEIKQAKSGWYLPEGTEFEFDEHENMWKARVVQDVSTQYDERSNPDTNALLTGTRQTGHTSGTAWTEDPNLGPAFWNIVTDGEPISLLREIVSATGNLTCEAEFETSAYVKVASVKVAFGAEAIGDAFGHRPAGSCCTGFTADGTSEEELLPDGLTKRIRLSADVFDASRPSACLGKTGFSVDEDLDSVVTAVSPHFIIGYYIDL